MSTIQAETFQENAPNMVMRLVYSIAMTHLFVQLKGIPTPTRVRAAEVEENTKDNVLLAKGANGKIIGKFNLSEVAGWWTIGE